MARRKGYIPANITIFSRAPDTWKLDAMHEGGTYTYRDHEYTHEVKGRKGFPVDTDKVQTNGTAQRWANAKPLGARSRVAMLFDDVDEGYEERTNSPIKNLRVFYLEERAEGGRAYKVIDEDGYVWDMREDVFMEALMEKGIKKGGHIGGEFVFGILGSQIRLVRVGSKLHADLVEGSKLKAQKKIAAKDLKVGHVYQSPSGLTGIFLGFVNAEGNKKKQQLWYTQSKAMTVDEIARELYADRHAYDFSFKTSVSFVMDLGEIPRPFTLDQVRTLAINECRRVMGEYTNYRRQGYYNNFRSYMGKPVDKLLTVTPHGVPYTPDDRVSTILTMVGPQAA